MVEGRTDAQSLTTDLVCLFVDDESSVLSAVKRVLHRENYRVLTASSAEEALPLLQAQKIAVVISDQMMPGMKGIPFLKKVQELSPETFRILLTGYSDQDMAIEAINEGSVFRFLTKPLKESNLKKALQQALDQYQLYAENIRLHQELVASFAALKKAEAARETLTHMVVHDLRSPLSVIQYFLREIESREGQDTPDDKPEDRAKWLQLANEATEELLALIQNILDINKYEHEIMPVTVSHFDITKVLQNLQERFLLRAEMEGVQLELDIPDEQVFVCGDRDLLLRVLQNLISNAFKNTGEPGKIILGLALEPDMLKIFVSDNGAGIPEEFKDRIFDKFVQVEARQSGKKFGVGLGLAFCRMAIQAMSGQIDVESQKDKGATFYVILPQSRQDKEGLL